MNEKMCRFANTAYMAMGWGWVIDIGLNEYLSHYILSETMRMITSRNHNGTLDPTFLRVHPPWFFICGES